MSSRPSAERAANLPMSAADEHYVLGPDSLPRADRPRGEVFQFTCDESPRFPGTTREIQVYVPRRFDGQRPACLYVGMDGLLFEAPTVLDNLIGGGEMPVTIAVGVTPGVVEAAVAANPRYNRSFEFDTPDGTLSAFVLEEVLPAVSRHRTSDGRRLLISDRPEDRAVGGASSGAIAAWKLAWERPHAFSRVFSAIGSYVAMRGPSLYPMLVRRTEPKPIRIALQDGTHDGLPGFLGEIGEWWLGNQEMQQALAFAGYDVRHFWGEGAHNLRHASAVFPEAMRWLWRDWPTPVAPGSSSNTMLRQTVVPDEGWVGVPGAFGQGGTMASAPQGLRISGPEAGGAWLLGPEETLREDRLTGGAYAAVTTNADATYFARDGAIFRAEHDGEPLLVAQDVDASAILGSHDRVYVLEDRGSEDGRLWLISKSGRRLLLDTGLQRPTAMSLSADGAWLTVAEAHGSMGYSYRVHENGELDVKQRFHALVAVEDGDGCSDLATDLEGRLFAATPIGVQVLDRNGRSRAILPLPNGRAARRLAFSGAEPRVLFALDADGRLFRRQLRAPGALPWQPRAELPAWTWG